MRNTKQQRATHHAPMTTNHGVMSSSPLLQMRPFSPEGESINAFERMPLTPVSRPFAASQKISIQPSINTDETPAPLQRSLTTPNVDLSKINLFPELPTPSGASTQQSTPHLPQFHPTLQRDALTASVPVLQTTNPRLSSLRISELQRAAVVQRKLTEEEKSDKLRILKDYVQFTPPTEFPNEYGAPPSSQTEYKLKLLDKIRNTTNAVSSLKTKKTMVEDDEDDNWTSGSYNEKVLEQAIAHIYDKGLNPKDGSRLIGRTDEEFDKHDCVWAAITYAKNLPNDISVERQLAASFSSQEGEVEDSILYRIMEKLGWEFQGQGKFNQMFPPLKPGTATTDNIKGKYNGRYIISEDINSGGTQGHVFAVDVADVADSSADLGYRRDITLTDRQHERRSKSPRTGFPGFTVYVWKVS